MTKFKVADSGVPERACRAGSKPKQENNTHTYGVANTHPLSHMESMIWGCMLGLKSHLKVLKSLG